MVSVFALDLAAAILSKLFTGSVEPWGMAAPSVVYACARRRCLRVLTKDASRFSSNGRLEADFVVGGQRAIVCCVQMVALLVAY